MNNLIRKLAAKHLLSIQNKPIQLRDLDFAFVDTDGIRYYEWASLSDIPVCRHTELMQMIGYSDAKISEQTLSVLCDEIDKRNHGIINEKSTANRQKLHAQMFALTNEIRDRSAFSVPKSIMIRMSSILVCREDEDPNKFNTTVNEEKVAQFTKDLNNGNAFFLKTRQMKELYSSLLGTQELLTQHLQNWELEHKKEIQRLKIISQSDDYNSDEKTKAN